MTWEPFVAGVVFGALFTVAAFVAFLTRTKRPRQEIQNWTDEHYQQPPVVTKITINRHRSFEI